MACPVDGATLVMSERQGVEIDYCPQCRGVWLDRGELDKIIERGSLAASAPAAGNPPPQQQPGHQQPQGYAQHKHHKRRKSFLEELFD
jgi:Zn-finger nucleic acid-binding protein